MYRLIVVSILLYSALPASADSIQLVGNEVGYEPISQKVVLVLSDSKRRPVKWQLRGRNGTVEGLSSNFAYETLSKSWVARIDLSEAEQVGNYTLTSGSADLQLVVARGIYREALQRLMRSFYLQRCGVALNDTYANINHHVCHVKDGIVRSDKSVHDGKGGWHDAGDYGKYVSTTAVVVAEILQLFEQFPAAFENLNTSIPESRNHLPDVLDEMRIGLDWLLRMQRRDGAFYRKLSGTAWPKLVPPEEDTQTRYLYGIATDDSAKSVAALSMAARIYAPYQPKLAKRYLSSAKKGWRFLKKNPEFYIDVRDDDNSGSGPYMYTDLDTEGSLTHDRDDRLMAAIELYLTTGKKKYLRPHLDDLNSLPVNLYEWKDPLLVALIDFLHHPKSAGHADLRALVAKKVMTRASAALKRTRSNQFQVANLRFVWGSNKMAAQEGILLLHAFELTNNHEFFNAAADQLHYLLGRNPFGHSFITGVGRTTVQNLNHIFARSASIDIPGLLVGGPNNFAQAGIAPKNEHFRSYADDKRSYATNEYAIDYSAAAINLITRLGALQHAAEISMAHR